MHMTMRMVLVASSYLAGPAVGLLPSAAPNISSGVVAVPLERVPAAPAKRRQDRSRPIVDVRSVPYAAVGRFKGAMVCTAAIVLHPRIIVTAGHCVTVGDAGRERIELIFQPGYQAGTDLGRYKATVWAVDLPVGSGRT
jgi:V8-like Glu-specific endopeptidase